MLLTYIPVKSTSGSKMADENTVKETCKDVKNTTPSTNIAGLADSVKVPIEDTELDELLDSTCCVWKSVNALIKQTIPVDVVCQFESASVTVSDTMAR